MENGNDFGPGAREKDFYERALERGANVNLFDGKRTHSGNVACYDRGANTVTLINWLWRKYHEDGSSRYIENPEPLELDIRPIIRKCVASESDRRGRLKKYNQDVG